MPRSWDVFCRVVDNYGDAAICWRLARQLAHEHGGRVRLWIDQTAALQALRAGVDASLQSQRFDGVDIRAWNQAAQFDGPAEVVIEAFGCGLPDAYVESMALRNPAPVWIILEYLSAEPWVASHHRMPSPPPRLPLERHFFFPGFAPGTGGVLREASLEPRRRAFDEAAKARFWKALGFDAPHENAAVVSLFGYENDAAEPLLQAWSEGETRVVASVPRGRLRPQVAAFFGEVDPPDGSTLGKGRLQARFLPFLPQDTYDELLWASDWNFVRGEDSFVRAQWARKPLAWHIYPQEERAHEPKLEAFLDLYCGGLAPESAAAVRTLWHGWNGMRKESLGPSALGQAWETLQAGRGAMRQHAESWARRLESMGNLAGNLALYCEERLK